MSERYIKIPISYFFESPWCNYSLKYRYLFLFILSRCVFKSYEYNLGGKIIILEPGQYITSLRKLTQDFNSSMNRVDDHMSKSSVDRALGVFARDQKAGHQAVQHAGHEETIISITDSIVLALIKNEFGTGSGTGSGTDAGQVRDSIKRKRIKDDQKDFNKKDDKKTNVQSSTADASSPLIDIKQDSSRRGSLVPIDVFKFIDDFVMHNGKSIKSNVKMRWLSKYGSEEVYESIKYYEFMRLKLEIPKPEAYLEDSLKNRYWETFKLREEAKEREKYFEKQKKDFA